MAINSTIETSYGVTIPAYIRLNNIEASNHGVMANALFRGFASKEAFQSGKSYLWEKQIQFSPDVSKPLWEQAYAALLASENFVDAVQS